MTPLGLNAATVGNLDLSQFPHHKGGAVMSIGVWIYLWVFYFVPLIYISVFVTVPYCLDDCSFVV